MRNAITMIWLAVHEFFRAFYLIVKAVSNGAEWAEKESSLWPAEAELRVQQRLKESDDLRSTYESRYGHLIEHDPQ